MKRAFFFGFIFCLAYGLGLFQPGMAYGQYYQTHQEERAQIAARRAWNLGPFQISSRLLFRDIGYDGNVYYQRQIDNPVSDYTATISPQINVHMLYRQWLILSFVENPEYTFYAKEKRERAFNNSFSPSLRILFFRHFVVSGNFQYRRARIRASSEFDLRAEEEALGYNGGVFYESPLGNSIGFTGSIRRLRYGDITIPGEAIDLSLILNREERMSQLEVNYKIFSGSLFFLKLGYSEYDFQSIGSRWKDSFSFQAAGGLRLPFSGRTRGVLSIGYKMLSPRRTWIGGFEGLTANVSLEYRLKPIVFRLQYNKDSNFSYDRNNVFYMENWLQAGVSVYLTKILRLDYNYALTKLAYPRVTPVWLSDGSYEEIKRRDFYHSQTAGVVVRILENTGLGLMANLFDRNSNYYWEGRRQRWFVGAYVTQDF